MVFGIFFGSLIFEKGVFFEKWVVFHCFLKILHFCNYLYRSKRDKSFKIYCDQVELVENKILNRMV